MSSSIIWTKAIYRKILMVGRITTSWFLFKNQILMAICGLDNLRSTKKLNVLNDPAGSAASLGWSLWRSWRCSTWQATSSGRNNNSPFFSKFISFQLIIKKHHCDAPGDTNIMDKKWMHTLQSHTSARIYRLSWCRQGQGPKISDTELNWLIKNKRAGQIWGRIIFEFL